MEIPSDTELLRAVNRALVAVGIVPFYLSPDDKLERDDFGNLVMHLKIQDCTLFDKEREEHAAIVAGYKAEVDKLKAELARVKELVPPDSDAWHTVAINEIKRARAAEAEVERLKANEAVCHCGATLSEHTLSDNHAAVPMRPACPAEARYDETVALLRSIHEAWPSSP